MTLGSIAKISFTTRLTNVDTQKYDSLFLETYNMV